MRVESCMPIPSAAKQLNVFLARFSPEIVALAKAARAKLRKRFPRAIEMVYDNYNALVIGFGPDTRTSDALFSIAVYPRWVTLFFLKGATLPDPDQVLKGSGTTVRHVVLDGPETLGLPAVHALMAEALRRARPSINPAGRRALIIKSVSPRQRPRRPS